MKQLVQCHMMFSDVRWYILEKLVADLICPIRQIWCRKYNKSQTSLYQDNFKTMGAKDEGTDMKLHSILLAAKHCHDAL